MNGFTLNSEDEKSLKIQMITSDHTLDFLGIQEVNLHLKIMGNDGVWSERHHATFEGYTHCATNLHSNSSSRRLFGGTACFMPRPTAHRAVAHGHDPTDLGRWTWTLLRGRQGIQTRIISAYRPVRSLDDEALTVYAQQELYFRLHEGWRDPRSAFFEDLDAEIARWSLEGDQIILGFDANQDTRSPDIQAWRTKWHMYEPLTKHHGPNNIATCRSNSSQTPIDTVWMTLGLDCTRCGMTGFGELDLGSADHRLLWMDVSLDSVFGMRPPPPTKRPTDSLPLNDPRIVTRYNNYVRRERARMGLGPLIFHLEHKAQQGIFTQDEDTKTYEAILASDHLIRKEAKKRCRPFYSGQVLFSDVIGQDRKEMHLWNMVIARRLGKRSDTRAIRRLIISTNQPRALQLTLEEALQQQTECVKRYKIHKKDHVLLHTTFRQALCERRAVKLNTSVEAQEKIVLNNKKQGNLFRKLNRLMSNKTRPSLTTVEYDNPDPSNPAPVICYNKEDIESACANEGRHRFSQNHQSPFMQGSLLRDLGYLATQSTVDLILQGKYQPGEEVDQYTKDLITQLRMPDTVGNSTPITGYITTAEHIAGWKKMKPTIASSPFGPLFSDHIAGCADVRVADIDAALVAIPVLTGYSPTAWHKAVDVMIPKKSSSTHVAKLRIIVLFHSLFNMINKNVGRLAVQRAEDLQLIPSEAYGSRARRRANICALNKVLTYDVLRQQRLPAALCSNDALSCYDRILHAIASLCLQRVGVSAETCHMMFGTLQQIEHYISTAFGLSEKGYGAINCPLQGVGQGNGAGPAIWLLISIPLINMLRDKGFGFRSTTAFTQTSYRFACYTFVDDTDTIHSTENPNTTYVQLISEMQEALNTWEGGLRATGGALSINKSYWYLLSMKWNHRTQRWIYQRSEHTPGTLSILGEHTVQRQTLLRHEPDHAEETLGLWIAPDSNQAAQIEALQGKLATWGDKIRSTHIPPSLAWLSVSSGISMALKYPLTATNLTTKDCHAIMRPFLDLALPAMGIPRRMPHAIVFAPKSYLGYGIFDLWIHQGVDQIKACLEFGGQLNNDITGHLLRDVTESLRLELGLPGPPLSYEYKKFYRCTTVTKLHILWQFCSDTGLILKDGLPDQRPLREGDQFLMAIFAAGSYSPKELSILNLCRMALRVQLLSDLCTGDGTSLRPDALEQRTPLTPLRTSIKWPISGTPNPHAWRTWRNALIRCLLPINSRGLTLQQPLGPWYGQPPGWPCFSSRDSNLLYVRDNQESPFRVYNKSRAGGHHTRRPTYSVSVERSWTIPPDANPTTVHGHNPYSLRHTGTHTTTSFPPTPETWVGSLIQVPEDRLLIPLGIRNHTAVAVTDGSFKDGMGTAGYTILPSINSPAASALIMANHTPGHSEDMDAYRAELGGILGSIQTIDMLCHQHHITEGTITIACDCLAAITNITQPFDPGPHRPHHDILSHIRHLVRHSSVTWNFAHVRGHQDDRQPAHLLDRWAQLNIEMDTLAKAYWAVLDRTKPPSVYLPPHAGQWSIWHGHYRLPCWTLARAQEVYHRASSELYWNKRLSPATMHSYDWGSSALALTRLPTHQRLWIPKWLCSTLPIGKNLYRWGHHDQLVCPRCGVDENHKFHVIICEHVEVL